MKAFWKIQYIFCEIASSNGKKFNLLYFDLTYKGFVAKTECSSVTELPSRQGFLDHVRFCCLYSLFQLHNVEFTAGQDKIYCRINKALNRVYFAICLTVSAKLLCNSCSRTKEGVKQANVLCAHFSFNFFPSISTFIYAWAHSKHFILGRTQQVFRYSLLMLVY